MLIKLPFTFLFALILLFFLRKVARAIGLVDKPSKRKKHLNDIPLVGGIAIFITITELIFNYPNLFRESFLYLELGFILVLVGALDDRFDISYRYRMIVQIAVAICMNQNGRLTNGKYWRYFLYWRYSS